MPDPALPAPRIAAAAAAAGALAAGAVVFFGARWLGVAPLGVVLSGIPRAVFLVLGAAVLAGALVLLAGAFGAPPADRLPLGTGARRRVRWPAAAGAVFLLAGAALLLDSTGLLWAAGLWLALARDRAARAEAALARRLGSAWAAYAAAVPRFMPRIRPARRQR